MFMPIKKEQEKYSFIKDKKMIAVIILILTVAMQIFAFLPVPGVTTIHKYTVGMLMGWYHPLFYGFIIFRCVIFIFNVKPKLPSWFKFSLFTYVFLSISIIFIIVSTGYFQSKGSWTEIGGGSWHAMNNWWDSFRDSGDAWIPSATNGGVIGAFMYSMFAMITSGIGAFIFSIILLILSISLLVSGSLIGLYKDLLKKKKMDTQKIEDDKENKTNISNIDTTTENKEDEIFPFDDPFS